MAYTPARDYKTTQRAHPRLKRWQDFGAGLGIGLVIALFAYGYAHRNAMTPPPVLEKPKPQTTKPPASATQAASASSAPAPRYDFYSMLPNFEVVVPEKERDVKRNLPPTAKVERPGVYVLQAGSYRNDSDAERVMAQLVRQSIDAKVQRVAVDNDVWFRVRIGPLRDLDQLNKLRRQLAASDVDALVIRVGD